MIATGDRKIVLIGLDYSGKTSIVLSLKGNRNLLSYYSLKPTPGLKIDEIRSESSNFSVWELGGQRIYIKKYLEDFTPYTQNVDKLIFVIDVQDIPRYPAALEYFENVIDRFRGCKSFPEISLFLHKSDPSLDEEKDEKYSGKVLNEKIVNKLAKIIGTDFRLSVFKTTIYTVFRKTPFTAMLGGKPS